MNKSIMRTIHWFPLIALVSGCGTEDESVESRTGSVQEAAIAKCSASPSAPETAPLNQNVFMMGAHSYSVTNDSDGTIKIVVQFVLDDSLGRRFFRSEPASIAAQGTKSGTAQSFLTALYPVLGAVTITARTEILGDAFCTASTPQRMSITSTSE